MSNNNNNKEEGTEQQMSSEVEHGNKARQNSSSVEGHYGATEFQPKILPQILAGISSNFAAIAWGTIMSWSAVAIPKMKTDEDFESPTDTQSSWVSSIAALGACLACFPASYLLDRFGRRKTMLCFAPVYVAGWLLIYFSKNVPMVIVGRGITGFCGGLYSVATPSYLAETSGRKIRGMLINGYDLLIGVGMLFIVIVGTYVSWRVSALVSAVVPVICGVMMFFMPESPRFLISKGRESEASKSLCWLRGAIHHDQILPEFQEIKDTIFTNENDSWGDRFKELIKTPLIRKAFVLSLILFLFQVVTGIAAVLFNQVEIFTDAGTSLDDNDSSMIVCAVQIAASVVSTMAVDRFGRRILLISSEILLAVSLAALGTFFHIKVEDPSLAKSSLDWLPLTSLVVYLVGFSLGMGPVPYSVMPELLPQRVRGLAASIVMTIKWGSTFLITRFFRDMRDGLGDAGSYWLFSGLCLCGTVYIFFFIPETKKLSLEQVQAKYFLKKK